MSTEEMRGKLYWYVVCQYTKPQAKKCLLRVLSRPIREKQEADTWAKFEQENTGKFCWCIQMPWPYDDPEAWAALENNG